MAIQKDNSTFPKKVALRRLALAATTNPLVLESHGGAGKLFEALYRDLPPGVVLEKDDRKVGLLAKQRPAWAVYQCDSVAALSAGIGSHLPINFLDVDPYGQPWTTIEAFLKSDRPKSEALQIVVNDGQRQAVQLGQAWNCPTLQAIVSEFGNNLYDDYLEICKILMDELATQSGYRLRGWVGYYCGHCKGMTHYWATLEQR
jgi:hypothetical protein